MTQSHGTAAGTCLAFVVCPSFHGATLLALLLNNHSQVSALGDTNPTRKFDQTCACGAKVSVCPFWQTISTGLRADRFSHLGTLLPSLPWPLAHHHLEGGHVAISKNAAVNRAAGRLAASIGDALIPAIWRRESHTVADYLQVWERFYGLVRELHGTSMVVDGSKSSRKVALMARPSQGPTGIKVIHLVRDPRGFVASTLRYEPEASLRTTTWLWSDLHARMEALGSAASYLRVRYEDLALEPEEEIGSVFDFLGVDREDVLVPPRFPEKHHSVGNSMLVGFDGTVRLDERWRDALSVSDQSRVLLYAGKVAERYGYG